MPDIGMTFAKMGEPEPALWELRELVNRRHALERDSWLVNEELSKKAFKEYWEYLDRPYQANSDRTPSYIPIDYKAAIANLPKGVEPPTEKQYSFAHWISDVLSISLPETTSKSEYSNFISQNIELFKKARKHEINPKAFSKDYLIDELNEIANEQNKPIEYVIQFRLPHDLNWFVFCDDYKDLDDAKTTLIELNCAIGNMPIDKKPTFRIAKKCVSFEIVI